MLTKDSTEIISMEKKEPKQVSLTASQKRRIRRKKHTSSVKFLNTNETISEIDEPLNLNFTDCDIAESLDTHLLKTEIAISAIMSTIEQKSRDDVKAAREAKKLAKQKSKQKGLDLADSNDISAKQKETRTDTITEKDKNVSLTSKDEVDRAINLQKDVSCEDKSKDQIKAERAAKKAAKQSKKKAETATGDSIDNDSLEKIVDKTMSSIAEVTKDLQEVHAKPEETSKSKAELKAERRAKQEAQRAAKQAQQAAVKPKDADKPKDITKASIETVTAKKETKPKPLEKTKTKSQFAHRVNWFQHLYTERNEDTLKNVALNSNLHPAIVKLGVQLATRVVSGSNARCIALLDALKKMISDYSLPAKTEFGRGLEASLSASVEYLWSMRQPAASQTNAVKHLRHHLTQLPNNVDEFDAKKTLHEEIDRYIREQIDMAGEAISIAVRNKISDGDTILTYGYSSLIERILSAAWSSGVKYSCVVVGARCGPGARAPALLRRLRATGLPCVYVDITALSSLINTVDKVLLGASSLLVNGSVLGAAGTAQVALSGRAHNVPVLVCCETHKFSERVLTDAFVYNELGDPDELIEKTDDNSPLKDWRLNPNLTPLNLTYDVTPPSLVTAVVTELAILPCTSAPVVLRFKLSEYGLHG